jgi:very-short-patch-repair endonuclease
MRNSRKYHSLPYDPRLRRRARELRRSGMLHEALLWNQLKQEQLNGLDFDRQKVIGSYIVDFYCAERAVVIEVDGSSHIDRPGAEKREAYLEGLGLTVIHIAVSDVLNNMNGVIETLRSHPLLK